MFTQFFRWFSQDEEKGKKETKEVARTFTASSANCSRFMQVLKITYCIITVLSYFFKAINCKSAASNVIQLIGILKLDQIIFAFVGQRAAEQSFVI